LSLAALCPVTATAADQPDWKTYQNGRFGFSVGYPADRPKPLPEPDGGDGRGFKALHGQMVVSVWAGYDSDTSLSSMAGEAERDCLSGKADYKVIRDKKIPPFMALSCMKAGQSVFYTKALVQGCRHPDRVCVPESGASHLGFRRQSDGLLARRGLRRRLRGFCEPRERRPNATTVCLLTAKIGR
jgi:hypothetical protein